MALSLVIAWISADACAHESPALPPGSSPGQALGPSPASQRGKDGEVAITKSNPVSVQVEIVATREGPDLFLDVDDYASNAPVIGAQVDLHQAGRSLRAAPLTDGRYRLPADVLDAAAPVTVTVRAAGSEQSLPIELPVAASPIESESSEHRGFRSKSIASLLVAIGAMLGIVVLRLRRRIDPLPS